MQSIHIEIDARNQFMITSLYITHLLYAKDTPIAVDIAFITEQFGIQVVPVNSTKVNDKVYHVIREMLMM